MLSGVNKTAFLHIFFKDFEREKKSGKIPTYLRQNTDFKNGHYHVLYSHATFILLVSKILILKVTYFYTGEIGCTLNLTRKVSRKVRKQIKFAMKF